MMVYEKWRTWKMEYINWKMNFLKILDQDVNCGLFLQQLYVSITLLKFVIQQFIRVCCRQSSSAIAESARLRYWSNSIPEDSSRETSRPLWVSVSR